MNSLFFDFCFVSLASPPIPRANSNLIRAASNLARASSKDSGVVKTTSNASLQGMPRSGSRPGDIAANLLPNDNDSLKNMVSQMIRQITELTRSEVQLKQKIVDLEEKLDKSKQKEKKRALDGIKRQKAKINLSNVQVRTDN